MKGKIKIVVQGTKEDIENLIQNGMELEFETTKEETPKEEDETKEKKEEPEQETVEGKLLF